MKTRYRNTLNADQWLTREQLKAVLAYVRKRATDRPVRLTATDRLIVETLVYTGIRRQELCNLDLQDLPMHHGHPAIQVRHGKRGSFRTIPIPKALAELLWLYVKQWRCDDGPKAPLFVGRSPDYGRLKAKVVYQKIVRIGRRALGIHLHPHVLRHSSAMVNYGCGRNIHSTKEMLGHRDIRTTLIYLRTTEGIEAAIANEMWDALETG